MLFTSTLLLAAIATLAQAGKFSTTNMPDGGYILSLDSSGNQVNQTIHPSAKVRGVSRLSQRSYLPADLTVTCRNDGGYDQNAMVASRNELADWCDSGNQIDGGGSVVFIHADAIYYACSNDGSNPCSSGEINQANAVMDSDCGAWTDVNLYIPDWAKTYGRDTPGHVC